MYTIYLPDDTLSTLAENDQNFVTTRLDVEIIYSALLANMAPPSSVLKNSTKCVVTKYGQANDS